MVHVGQRLYETRVRLGWSLDDVAKATKIKRVFLEAIEQGHYDQLPSSAYAQGFVSNYAVFLGLPKREVLALFRREFNAEKQMAVLPEGLPRGEFSIKRVRIHQGVIAVFLLLLLIGAYIGFQFRSVFFSPPLTVTVPLEGDHVVSPFTLHGKTDSLSTVFVNQDSVATGKDGIFSKKVELFPGKNTVTVRAVNRFGKETVVERHVDVGAQ